MFICVDPVLIGNDAGGPPCDGATSDRPDDPDVVAAAAGRVVPPRRKSRVRPPARRRSHRTRAPPDDDASADAYSIAEFCRRHSISESFYFALQAAGEGPRVMKVGGRVLISREAAAAWRRRRERAARV
jgi:hypothetical protein